MIGIKYPAYKADTGQMLLPYTSDAGHDIMCVCCGSKECKGNTEKHCSQWPNHPQHRARRWLVLARHALHGLLFDFIHQRIGHEEFIEVRANLLSVLQRFHGMFYVGGSHECPNPHDDLVSFAKYLSENMDKEWLEPMSVEDENDAQRFMFHMLSGEGELKTEIERYQGYAIRRETREAKSVDLNKKTSSESSGDSRVPKRTLKEKKRERKSPLKEISNNGKRATYEPRKSNRKNNKV